MKNRLKIFMLLILMEFLLNIPFAAADTMMYSGKISGVTGIANEGGVGLQTESVNYVVYNLGNRQTFKVLFGGTGQMVSQRKGYITCGNYVYSEQENSTDIWRECWNYLGNAPVWVDEYTLYPRR